MTALTGFFSQQLLLFGDCAQRTDTAVVRLARTNNYTASGRKHGMEGPNWWSEYAPMVAAMTVGLVQPVEDFTNVFARGCDSGNCKFPSSSGASFSTVAISHICEDISGLIRERTYNSPYNSTWITTALTTPDGAPTNLNISDPFTVMKTSTTATEHRSNGRHPLSTITLLFRDALRPDNFSAVNCTVFPTVNTYSVEIADTLLKETLLNSVPLDLSDSGNTTNAAGDTEGWNPTDSLDMFALATNYTLRDGNMEPCTGSAVPAPGLIQHFKLKTEHIDEDGIIFRTSTRWYYPKDCLWGMSIPATSGMRRHFDTMFSEQILTAWGQALTKGNVYLRALWQEMPEEKKKKTDTGSSLVVQTSRASIDKSFSSMTRAMTAFVRTHGDQGEDEYVKGVMWSNTTCVYMRWEWIAFPVAMIALTGLFLLLVIIDNWGIESDRLWKSSILATLFCEVDVQRDRPKGKEEMEKIAKSTSVSLEGKSGRLRMVTREQSHTIECGRGGETMSQCNKQRNASGLAIAMTAGERRDGEDRNTYECWL
jgi:hypothetical protein